ncbi:LacI family DNA-binding transcriptional regulator [Sansalvadorimonas verongulae]|uniref:LacI family DNA-binding transcriptional regulator n=1 Tax=Sansalvadorimonas verongulae TaxID=2172824 RepID=UPI0012BCB987|nr:LacI family DNA-binding transcriptional regulator [Sansalvadorimonas verongulae]MTI13831.1 LacI family DNA-binding transcriptional regulator [Sansalvadorimonas verongulae]
MGKVTFKDVARLAGVSTQTVSRVTNNAHNVNDETRAKVLSAIQALGYVPSKSAQLLGRKKSRLLGLLTLDFAFYGAAMTAAGIRNAATARGYSVVIGITNSTAKDKVVEAIRELIAQQVEGIVINMPLSPEEAVALVRTYPDTPIAFTDTLPTPGLVTVMSDHKLGAKLTVEHLIALKRHHIACLNGPQDSTAAELRRQGWLSTLKEHQLEPVAQYIGDWSAVQGYELARQLLQKHPGLDALVCANDQMALGALKALHEAGQLVPRDVLVTGFDDTPDSIMYQPSLTTVRQDFPALGEQVVAALFQWMASPGRDDFQAISQKLAVTFIARASTACGGQA